MNRSQGLRAAAVFVIATTAGCFESSTRESGEALPVPPPAAVDVTSDAPPEDRFYILLQGGNSSEYDLYELRLSPRSLTQVTNIGRVSSVGACGDRVVVAAAQKEVGLSDHIQEVQGGQLIPLAGLGLTEGFSPDLMQDCRVAYTWPDRSLPEVPEEVRVWNPASLTGSTLYRTQSEGESVSPAAWGPVGEIAFVRGVAERNEAEPAARQPAVVIIRPDHSVTELDAGVAQPGVFEWGRTLMAISDEKQGVTVLLDPATGKRTALPGWRPVDWSPDGTRLLVSDRSTEKRLGFVDEGDLTSVREVAVLNRAVGGGVWLPV